MRMQFTTGAGRPVVLENELGRGGEGVVFNVTGRPDVVAKVYHLPPSKEKADKLVAMANGCTERLRNVAAWPVDTIHDTTTFSVRGFVMHRISRQCDIHVLYGPKTRLRHFPDAGYRFLVHVAANVARAFAVVHDHGHVIGDVNQGGVCVSSQGTVTLVDCDSFQVRAPQRVFSCDVGIPIYQPPELQSVRSYHGLARNWNHDNFGLAVLIFQTLFLARHPFAGSYQGDLDMPIERAIREYRFAYGRDASQRRMKQPPGSLGLGAVSADAAQLFERAFLEAGTQNGRPSALEWISVLDRLLLELRQCALNSAHAFPKTLALCPLCDIEGRIGVLLFIPLRPQEDSLSAVDLEAVWSELRTIIDTIRLRPSSALGGFLPPPPATIEKFKRKRSQANAVLFLGLLGSFFLLIWNPAAGASAAAVAILIAIVVRGPAPKEAQDIERRLADAQRSVDQVLRSVDEACVSSGVPKLTDRAEALYQRIRSYSSRRSERARDLERTRHERQLHRFLDQFEVRDSALKGFGKGLFAALVSNGVETADDLTIGNLSEIPGIGAARRAALLNWRRALEAKFKFNPFDADDSRDRIRVDRELQLEQAKDVIAFRQLAEQVKAGGGPLVQRLRSLHSELDRARAEFATLRAIAVALGVTT